MPRPNRLVAGLLVATIVLAACVPWSASLDAVFEVAWVLLPDAVPIVACPPVAPCDEQPVALLSLVSSRAPPSHPLA